MGQKEAVLRIAGASLFCAHLVRRLQAGAQGPWRAHLQQSQGHQHPTKRDQLKSLVTVETAPHGTPCARCSRLPAPRPKGSRLLWASSGSSRPHRPHRHPQTHLPAGARGSGCFAKQGGEKLFPKLASKSALAPKSKQSEQRK